jgi:hypothetical protein
MLDFRSAPKTKNLVYYHPMNISAKVDSNLFCGFRKKDENESEIQDGRHDST